jgi:hypothetical protein
MRLVKSDVLTHFGSVEAFDSAVASYTQALADHAKTVGVPAPTASPIVEHIVKREAGKYIVVDDTAIIELPKPTLAQRRSKLLADLAALRYSAQVAGVTYDGQVFPSDANTLTVFVGFLLTAAQNEILPFKIGADRYGELNATEVRKIVRTIRAHHQKLFDREREIVAEITAAKSHSRMDEIEIARVIE